MDSTAAADAVGAGLAGVTVLDVSTGIAGAYCSLLLAQAGANVTVAEVGGPHPLRSRHTPGAARAGVLFDHMSVGKDVVAWPADRVPDWDAIDVLVADPVGLFGRASGIAAGHPRLVVATVSPYGGDGPDADRPGNDFLAQADSGALVVRGLRDGVPFAAGGDVVEWLGGAYAAAGAVASWFGQVRDGQGDHIDVALTEVAHLICTTMTNLFDSLKGRPERTAPARTVETPSIEPASDGYVGVTTNTVAQLNGFLDTIERSDLVGDPRFSGAGQRFENLDEWNAVIRAWTLEHTVEEFVARAVERRVPVAAVNAAPAVLELEHATARGSFVDSPDGSFRRPVTPWRHHAAHGGGTAAARGPSGGLPLSSVRVVDLTAWWAGPSASAVLAAFGADVIHVEGPTRPDGLRLTGLAIDLHERWYDRGFFFHQPNTNKRSLVVDLASPDGVELLLQLVERADVLIENFTPRVMENFGIGFERLAAVNPRLVMTRLPAFGLDGPWRDQPGFAQTMEQITGLAWVTGHPDDQPRVPRGPCDPNGGLHAAIATLVALADVDRGAPGRVVEVPLFDSALAIAAEQVVEWTANGFVLGRQGNRSHHVAPQGLYACAGHEEWLAVSCLDDEHWQALVGIVPALLPWAGHDLAGRRDAHDAIDDAIAPWCAARSVDAAVAALRGAGVGAAVGRDPRDAHLGEQMASRGFFEDVELPTLGVHPVPTWPFTSARIPRWTRMPPPCFGEHNDEILAELGVPAERRAALYDSGVMSTRPVL